jgi:putative ABC transport system ATP-binding protein
MVEIEAVERSYAMPGGQACAALRGITLSIARGEYVAVLGKSGSGKSTLLNLVAGLDRPDAGTVRVGDQDLSRLGESALAGWRGAQLGVVFQFFQLMPTLTVVENIMLAMELVGTVPVRDRSSRALALLERVELADQARKLPSALSGGQQQRAAVARALANDPPLVIADEPTGNLDSETAAHLGELFASLVREGKTLVVVTHDDALAHDAHRVIRLRDGKVLADERASESGVAPSGTGP